MEYIISDTTLSHAAKFACVPIDGEIIRCRDCRGSKDGPWHKCETYLSHGEDPNGCCAWAERDA